jgi:hypothetical protein
MNEGGKQLYYTPASAVVDTELTIDNNPRRVSPTSAPVSCGGDSRWSE